MRPLRTLLIDDEPLALRRLAATLSDLDGVDLLETTTSARRGVDLIRHLKPDVALLDITMPSLDGFDVLENLSPEERPAVIFVTAHASFAVKAFEVEAIDYLLKPVSRDRLRRAMTRARRWLARGSVAPSASTDRIETPDTPFGDSLWVHRHQIFDRVTMEDIMWIEAQGDYVRVHAPNGGMARMTLTELELILDPNHFIRVHRSAICRRSAIVRVRRKATGAVVATLVNGDEVPVGRTYSGGLRTFLNRIDPAEESVAGRRERPR